MTIDVRVIADTYNSRVPSARITTFQIYAPRFLLAEINTHRVISKSAASSRAIPVAKRIQMVRDDPYVPSTFGKNKKGMSADEALEEHDAKMAEDCWRGGITTALYTAEGLEKLGLHKQQANRVLEPYAHFYGVLTATEWDNFWSLRISKAAQPEFMALASEMRHAYGQSNPRSWAPGHLPYNPDYGMSIENALKVCTARCARVSYQTFDGKLSLPEDDLKLCEQLTAEGHLSPFDHPAAQDSVYQVPTNEIYWSRPEDQRQYWGWIPHRVEVEKRLGFVGRRSSYAELDPLLVSQD